MEKQLEFETLEVPPGIETFSLAGCPIRATRQFDIGEPGERMPHHLFRLDVMVKGFEHPFIIGWAQESSEPEPNPDKMLTALLRLGAYTIERISK